MFELFKANRINKITATHSEDISDSMILMNIVNAQEAKKNLDPAHFREFMNVFGKISKDKKEYPADSLEYEHRAFRVAYQFEWEAEVNYSDICGDAKDILYMYTNMKPRFEEIVNEMVSKYTSIIESIISDNASCSDPIKICGLAQELYLDMPRMILASYTALRKDTFVTFSFEMAFKNVVVYLVNNYLDTMEKVQEANKYHKILEGVHQAAYDNNDTLDGYIENLINSFMSLCDAPSDEMNKHRLMSLMMEYKQIGENA